MTPAISLVRALMLGLAAAGLAAPATAQERARPRSEASVRDGIRGPAAQERRAAAACTHYGPGFMPLPGTSTCVRASGRVSLDAGALSVGSGGGGRFQVDTRTETDHGPVRAFVRSGMGRR